MIATAKFWTKTLCQVVLAIFLVASVAVAAGKLLRDLVAAIDRFEFSNAIAGDIGLLTIGALLAAMWAGLRDEKKRKAKANS